MCSLNAESSWGLVPPCPKPQKISPRPSVKITGIDLSRCPCCQKGTMIVVGELPRTSSRRDGIPHDKRSTAFNRFNSPSALGARVCLRVRNNYSLTRHRSNHRKSIGVGLYLHRLAARLLPKLPSPRCGGLYNPHSRSCTAATRFSPTRFIPPLTLSRSSRGLIASRLWGIKRYPNRDEATRSRTCRH